MTFPEPVISVAIEPKTKSDQEKLGMAIQTLAEEDPTFRVESTRKPARQSSQVWANFTWRSWLTACVASSGVEANVGKPQVAYRETIKRTVEKHDYTHKKQTGGSGQFAKVQIKLEPAEVEGDKIYEFVDGVTGGRVPREYIPSVDAGMQGRYAVRCACWLPGCWT